MLGRFLRVIVLIEIMKQLKGANMDIDLIDKNVDWEQDKCP